MALKKTLEKPYLRTVFLFFGGLILILVILSMAVQPGFGEVYDIVAVRDKLEALSQEKPGTVDVYFAGNSEAYRSFSPLQLWVDYGITSYCIAGSALRLCDNCEILKASWDMQQPKIIVLETDAIFSDSSPHKDEYALPTNFIEDVLPIFHYHIFYKSYMPKFIDRANPVKRDAHILKGYVQSDAVVPYTGPVDYMAPGTKGRILGESLKYLNEIHRFAKENGTELVIAAVPCPLHWNMGKHEAMQKWCDENQVPFVDMNLMIDKMGIDWAQDTMDGGNHVNLSGSIKVTECIGDFLNDNYDLPNHTFEPGYQEWDELYEEAELY